ncbi:transmembrane protein 26-like [Antedon mediterranea]|uniref:transmembrane protein 26-like n=1 Tax=Antedon mediterranea TaxID=105859 RepID=UPI003AF888EF
MVVQEEEASLRSTLLSKKVGRGLMARGLFTAHAMLCVYKVAFFVENSKLWLLLLLLGTMYIEFIVLVIIRKGKEWKWFFVSILCYLMVVIPSIWLLEKDVLDARLAVKMNDDEDCGVSELSTNNTIDFLLLFGLDGTSENWSLILQQLLIFVLIIGRWILPRGDLTGDQLSQLLLVYIGSGADILEFASEGLRLDEIKCDITIIYVILTIWTISLLQFTLPLTAKTRRRPIARAGGVRKIRNGMATCCATEVWSIIVVVMTQDAPFLVVRMYLLISKNVVNELLIFFACKNILTILLQGNRFRTIMKERIEIRRSRRNRFAVRWVGATHAQSGEQHQKDPESEIEDQNDADYGNPVSEKVNDIETGIIETPQQDMDNGNVDEL